MTPPPLISRDELLSQGLGGDRRRGETALALIEARAEHEKRNRGQVNAPYQTEDAFSAGTSAYLSAIAERDGQASNVSMRDIERSAEAWSDIAPGRPEVQAWVAKLLGEKYRFNTSHAPATIAALGLAEAETATAFSTAFGAPLDSIYETSFRPVQAFRWQWSRLSVALESLPPFWTAFALTVTEIVGAGTLALPIALSTIGPIAGLGILLFVGLINIVTVAYLAEASARNGTIVYGSAFIGKLVQDFLGPAASFIVRMGLFLFCCSVLIAYYTGFSSTLSAFSGCHPMSGQS